MIRGYAVEDLDIVAGKSDPILITGASGFIGRRVVETLLSSGFENLRCLTRHSSDLKGLLDIITPCKKAKVGVIEGNLLRPDDCKTAVEGVYVVYHLAAGRGEKSFPNAFLNSVVTTRNLLNACLANGNLKRFVNVSSFTVYNNRKIRHGGLLDESCPMEKEPEKRGEAYCYAKVKQDELVVDYGRRFNIPYVIMRPGVVYGPGNKGIHGRVGIGTFGLFLHLGGANIIPLTYVDNCAEAIALAGIKKGIDGEIFNIVDDGLPTSRQFLRSYKRNVRRFPSIYLPRFASYMLCFSWERYSEWSRGQLPPAYNRYLWAAVWKGDKYSNQKVSDRLGWRPKIDLKEGLRRYFEYAKKNQ